MAELRIVADLRPDGSLTPFTIPTGVAVTVVARGPRVVRVRLVGMLFDIAKTHLLPNTLLKIRELAQLYAQHNGWTILVTGHTDTVGKPQHNDELSLARAQSISAYLRDDVDAWLANYSSAAPSTELWGETEDMAMLRSLPHGGPSYLQDVATTDEAIRSYQRDKGLSDDGILGDNTRRALVTDYMGLDGTTLPADASVVEHGCGEHFNAVVTGDDVDEAENRRAELFFFSHAILPEPPAQVSGAADTQYAEWVERCTKTTDVDAGGGDAIAFEGEIHLELRSNSGAVSLAHAAYSIKLANGDLLDGTANEIGRLRHEKVPPGDYELELNWGDDVLRVPIATRPPGLEAVLVRVTGARADVAALSSTKQDA